MRLRAMVVSGVMLLVAFLPGSAMAFAPGAVADQSDLTLTAIVSSDQDLAQTFTAGLTGQLTDVSLNLAGTSGSLTVAITATSGGVPAGAPLATSAPVTPGSSAGWLDFSFASPPAVTSGVMYAIVFNLASLVFPSSASGSIANTYGSGAAMTNTGSSWVSINANFSDFAFYTLVRTQSTTLAWDKAQVVAGTTTPLTLTETFTFSPVASLAVAREHPNALTVVAAVAQVVLPSWFTVTGVACSSQIAALDCVLANVGPGFNVTTDGNPVTVTLTGTASPALAAVGTTGTATAEGCAVYPEVNVVPAQLPGVCINGSANVAVVAANTTPPPTTAYGSRSTSGSDSATWLLPAGLLGLLGAALLVNRQRRLMR